MFVKSLPVVALAVAAVNGSPVINARQASSEVSSAVSSAASAVSSAISSAASSAVSGASSAVSGASSAVSSAASSAVATATAAVPTNGTSGNQTFPAYPCPPGYLLTYVEQNVTIAAPYPTVRDTFGIWANSSLFGSLVVNTTSSGVGSSHFLNLQGIIVEETLVNVTRSNASRVLTWNLTNGPIEAMGVGISNYSTVLSLYDPDFEANNSTLGNTTVALTFTNFCATSQAEGMTLVSGLGALELGNLQQAVAAGEAPPSSSVPAPPSSSVAAPTSMPANMTASVTALPSSVASSVASGVSSEVGSVSSSLVSALNSTTAA